MCGSDKARLTLAKSRLCVVTCNGCNFQGFARSDRSDELLRARIVTDAPAAPEREPVRTEPVRTEPAPTPQPPAPVRTAAPAPAQAAPKPADAFGGLLDWMTK